MCSAGNTRLSLRVQKFVRHDARTTFTENPVKPPAACLVKIDRNPLRRRRARWNESFRFFESKFPSQLVPEQQKIDAHLNNDGPHR